MRLILFAIATGCSSSADCITQEELAERYPQATCTRLSQCGREDFDMEQCIREATDFATGLPPNGCFGDCLAGQCLAEQEANPHCEGGEYIAPVCYEMRWSLESGETCEPADTGEAG